MTSRCKHHDMAPLPPCATQLVLLLSSPGSTIDPIVEVVLLDRVPTARVLRWANSAASGAVAPIRSIKDAVIHVGRGPILVLAFGPFVAPRMRTPMRSFGYADEDGL